MKPYVSIILVIAILANTLTFALYRIKSNHDTIDKLQTIRKDINSELQSLTVESLQLIDNYMRSNLTQIVTAFVSDGTRLPILNSTFDITQSSTNNNQLTSLGSISYYYYEANDFPYARLGLNILSVGDRFPRGGVVTDIFDDCIVVDNCYIYNNDSPHTFQPSKYIPTDNTMTFNRSRDIMQSAHNIRENIINNSLQ